MTRAILVKAFVPLNIGKLVSVVGAMPPYEGESVVEIMFDRPTFGAWDKGGDRTGPHLTFACPVSWLRMLPDDPEAYRSTNHPEDVVYG